MVAKKEVKIEVVADAKYDKIEELENHIKKLENEKINLEINTATEKLNETQSKIESLKNQRANLEVGVDDEEINKINAEIADLSMESINLQIQMDSSELKKAKAEVDELDNSSVDIDLQLGMQNFSQGLSQAKQGISELKQNMDEVAQAGMQSEQNKAFLNMNLGGEKAKKTYQDISDIVASMPGDDNTMRSVLSTAQALGNNLNANEMKAAAGTMADYMSGSATMGKMALESQQDIMKYLLDGNTAELERGSIVSSQVDKLKEASTFQERQAAMQQVLNELGYGGIANQDTMLNKQAEWEGMIYNSQDALSSMWLGAEKGAMDYIIRLNDASNGIVGMGIVAGQMIGGPLFELVGSIGQVGLGLSAVKDGMSAVKSLEFIKWLNELSVVQKLSALSQMELNFAFLTNPIFLVVAAVVALIAVLGYLYFNNEQVRAAVDGLGQSLMMLGSWVYNGAIYWLEQLRITLMNLWNYIFTLGGLLPANVNLTGNQITNTILRVLLFIATLPMQLNMIFINIIAKALGFGDNFAQRMINGAVNAVNGFINKIRQLPGMIQTEFARIEGIVSNFVTSLPQRVWDLGASIVDALKSALGIGSPGHMYYMFEGELKRLDNLPGDMQSSINHNVSLLGSSIVDSFGEPELGYNINSNSLNNDLNNVITGNGGKTGGDTIINIYGDVDSEKRVQQIKDVIQYEINWNNTTGGRTV